MSGTTSGAGNAGTVFFLSDYGRSDEFVGVVHAVLVRLAPGVAVVDLTHEIPSFDVRAGAAALLRALAYLGPGIVLGVVDPGVGGPRRGLVLGAPGPGPWAFVGPDNGLLLPAVEAAGGPTTAVALPCRASAAASGAAVTFDGRDLFAPVVAALARGSNPGDLGDPVAIASLVWLPEARWECRRAAGGRVVLAAEITWVDGFGNVQLAAPAQELPAVGTRIDVRALDGASSTHLGDVRRVSTFADLEVGELGVLGDANGQVTLVVGQGRADGRLGLDPGGFVELRW